MKKNKENIEKLKISKKVEGLWIPIDIMLNENLTATEKQILGLIFVLEFSEKGVTKRGCFASNAYIATMMTTTRGAISKAISVLKKKGFLTDKYILDESKGVKDRILNVTDPAMYKKSLKGGRNIVT